MAVGNEGEKGQRLLVGFATTRWTTLMEKKKKEEEEEGTKEKKKKIYFWEEECLVCRGVLYNLWYGFGF